MSATDNLCDKYCVGCIYRGKWSTYSICQYILYKGNRSRGCPPGYGCIRKQKGHTVMHKVGIHLSNTRLSADEENRRTALYLLGYNDQQIGKTLGIKPSAIASWRKMRKLQSNVRKRRKEVKK